MRKKEVGTCDIAQPIKMFAAKLEELNLIPETHMVENTILIHDPNLNAMP